jgi:hypothetical protein
MTAPTFAIPEPTLFDHLLSLKGRCAVVTGGTRRIGEAIVLRLAEAGASIVAAARGQEGLTRIEEKVAALDGQTAGIRADAGNVDDGQRVIDFAISRFGSTTAALLPKIERSKEGFSPAAGGGNAPIAAIPRRLLPNRGDSPYEEANHCWQTRKWLRRRVAAVEKIHATANVGSRSRRPFYAAAVVRQWHRPIATADVYSDYVQEAAMRLIACVATCLVPILAAAQMAPQTSSDSQAYCVNRSADFYPYTGETCKGGYQLGSGNCRKTNGRIVAVPREECLAQAGTVELPVEDGIPPGPAPRR